MTSKTERFEMRLDQATIDNVEAWRSRQDDFPSRAEAIRRLVENGLETSAKGNLRITDAEKLTLWLLAEILKTQKDYGDKKRMELLQESILGGHLWAIQWEFGTVLPSHVDSQAALTLVINTLDMWSFIEEAHKGFGPEEKKQVEGAVKFFGKDPRFVGFDGNNEIEYLSIARFLVEKLGRFQEFKGRDFNSHTRLVERYQKMTDLFEPIRANLVGRGLSAAEMIALLNER
jgi:uncharacterized protein YfbU (UPF0304 family)